MKIYQTGHISQMTPDLAVSFSDDFPRHILENVLNMNCFPKDQTMSNLRVRLEDERIKM